MENASKALIIVGSILVSIVIISLGVMIVNNATGLVKSNSDMSAQEVETFNSKFSVYEGRQSGTNVRALVDKIKANNNQNANDKENDFSLCVAFTVGDTEYTSDKSTKEAPSEKPKLDDMKVKIKAGKSYNVTFAYDGGSGRITACNAKEIK